MLLNAVVVSGEVSEYKDFDPRTGSEQAGYSVKLTVLDADTDEKYVCQLTDGFDLLETLKEMKRQKHPIDDLRQVAAQLEAQLPAKFTMLQLEVLRLKGKSAQYLTMVCRFVQAAATAQAA